MTPDQAAGRLLARLSGDDAAALDALLTLIASLRSRQTLGGEPPPFNAQVWKNKAVGAGVHPDYQGRL